MKFVKLLLGLPLASALLFSACKSSETVPSNVVFIGVRQSARLASNMVVRADSIQDSRCPSDVVCFWAGVAQVKLALSTGNDSTTIRLSLSPTQKDATVDAKLNNSIYKVILHEVSPYPTLANLTQLRTALVEVIKL